MARDCANFQGAVVGIIKLIEAISTYTLNSCFYIPMSLKQPLQYPHHHFGRQEERNHMEKTGNGSPQFKGGEHTRIQPGKSGRRLTASKDEGLKRGPSSHIIWVCTSLKTHKDKEEHSKTVSQSPNTKIQANFYTSYWELASFEGLGWGTVVLRFALTINTFSFLNTSQNEWDKWYCSLEPLRLLLTAMHWKHHTQTRAGDRQTLLHCRYWAGLGSNPWWRDPTWAVSPHMEQGASLSLLLPAHPQDSF